MGSPSGCSLASRSSPSSPRSSYSSVTCVFGRMVSSPTAGNHLARQRLSVERTAPYAALSLRSTLDGPTIALSARRVFQDLVGFLEHGRHRSNVVGQVGHFGGQEARRIELPTKLEKRPAKIVARGISRHPEDGEVVAVFDQLKARPNALADCLRIERSDIRGALFAFVTHGIRRPNDLENVELGHREYRRRKIVVHGAVEDLTETAPWSGLQDVELEGRQGTLCQQAARGSQTQARLRAAEPFDGFGGRDHASDELDENLRTWGTAENTRFGREPTLGLSLPDDSGLRSLEDAREDP